MSNDTYADFNVCVRGLIPGCPAEKAGVKRGDVIISVNGKPVKTFDDYAEATLDRTNVQHMDIIREGQLIQVTVNLHARKSLIQEEPDFSQIIDMFKQTG